MKELPALYPNRKFISSHEGIERENPRTTKGVRWTPEELRELVNNTPRIDFKEKTDNGII